MWKTVRAQIVTMTMLVVVTSVALTAIIVSLSVQSATRAEAARSLSGDSEIYQALLEYGTSSTSWDDVGPTVESLARTYDRRIALKSEDGRLLVDSDALLEESSGPLRARAEVVVDPYDPRIAPTDSSETAAEVITAEDRVANAERVASASQCLDRLAIPYDTTTSSSGLAEVSVNVSLSDDQWTAASGCLNAVFLPLPSQLDRVTQENTFVVGCLAESGFSAEIVPDDFGGTVMMDRQDTAATQAFDTCREAFARSQFAPAVQLFLGSADNGFSIQSLASGTTVIIALIIIAIAGVAALFLAGRIAHPLRRLALVADQLGAGNLAARVTVPDRTEIGTLAERFNAMAESLDRSETARQQMVSDISHELRNPLVTLKGSLEAVQDGVYTATPELIDSLVEEAEHLHRMVADLQELASADAGDLTLERQRLDLADILAAGVAAHQPTARAAGLQLTLEVSGPLEIEGDATRLRQVLINLLSNASEHTPEGGSIRVRGERRADTIRFSVSDTGKGIAAADLPYVFGRFWRADTSRTPSSGRRGLGLAISEALAQAHGGTITVESAEGEGTVFTVDLPRALTDS